MDEVNVSQASKFNWLKNKVNLDVVPSSKESSKRLLIGKILSKKSFPKALVKEILTNAWNVLNEVQVCVLDRNVFVFSFKHDANVKRA